ncbi:hypothetical protein BKA61DRAFT_733669 [Leptodontidium sp. MPI-SDFR-AT-0119]|nr:hypothetical protein BKA61DRAFT_733669 [Leptodontidium sp. MPI-SDFR-AT-0119]
MQAWGQWELEEPLKAWGRLVAAIEERMPTTEAGPESSSNALVENRVADRWADHPFELEFLIRARAPKKSTLKVAPGVKAWTTPSFEAAHVNEPNDGERKLAIGTRPDDHPSRQSYRDRDLAPALLFSSEASVPKPASQSVENFWGRRSVLLERKAGLYLYPGENWGDAVVFVDGTGGDKIFTDVLAFWTFLATDNVWQVDENSVVGDMDYFNDLNGSKKLVNMDGVLTEVDSEQIGVLHQHSEVKDLGRNGR